MNLTVKRAANVLRGDRAYCIGHLYIDGVYFCDTLEDYDRGLDAHDDIELINAQKVAAKTAIPTGQYEVDMDTVSPKYLKKPFYRAFCNAKMPRLCYVRGYQGVLIHSGNNENDTEGCLLVGQNKVVGKLINSLDTWKSLYMRMSKVHDRHEGISINIIRQYKV